MIFLRSRLFVLFFIIFFVGFRFEAISCFNQKIDCGYQEKTQEDGICENLKENACQEKVPEDSICESLKESTGQENIFEDQFFSQGLKDNKLKDELFSQDLKESDGLDKIDKAEKVDLKDCKDFSYEAWRKKIFQLEKNPSLKIVDEQEFVRALGHCIDAFRKSSFCEDKNWVGPNVFRCFASEKTDRFFVQKIFGDEFVFYVHADVHGDILSVAKFFDSLEGIIGKNFEILDKKNYIVFLGDYSDRGQFSTEVLHVMALLKATNPENVILIRGNHESKYLNESGLHKELSFKFNFKDDEESVEKYEMLLNLLNDFYNHMPVALFAGALDPSNNKKIYTLFCHGGIDFGFNPNFMLESDAKIQYKVIRTRDYSWFKAKDNFLGKKSNAARKFNFSYDTDNIDFLWADFSHDSKKSDHIGDRGLVYSEESTLFYKEVCSNLQKGYELKFIIRGHQHNEEFLKKMIENGGLLKLWVGKDKMDIKREKLIDVKDSFEVNLDEDTSVLTLAPSPICIILACENQKDEIKELEKQKTITEALLNMEKKLCEGAVEENILNKEKKSGEGDAEKVVLEKEGRKKALLRNFCILQKKIELSKKIISCTNFNYDAHAKFSMSKGLDSWKFEVCRVPVYPKTILITE